MELLTIMVKYPSYIKLYEEGKLKERVETAYNILKECTVCPHQCKVDRLKGNKGLCKTTDKLTIASFFPHQGEELPIRGINGSGTIFISNCNMSCVFCQNWDISQKGEGYEYYPEEVADIMLFLQEKGCHNINWVTPSHVVPQLLKATYIAVKKGLSIPIVYNTSSYDSIRTLRLLENIVDIYLPDFKFADDKLSIRYSKTANYTKIAINSIKEMHRQVGDLKTNSKGVAYKGLLVRHLVMPNNVSNSIKALNLLKTISPNIHVNVMKQYYPSYKSNNYPELNRTLYEEEFKEVLNYARKLRLKVIRD